MHVPECRSLLLQQRCGQFFSHPLSWRSRRVVYGQHNPAMALHGVCEGLVAGGGFRKQNVQHNDFCAGIGKLVNQPGMEVAVPRPAPERV